MSFAVIFDFYLFHIAKSEAPSGDVEASAALCEVVDGHWLLSGEGVLVHTTVIVVVVS